jgi:hypothetical protein
VIVPDSYPTRTHSGGLALDGLDGGLASRDLLCNRLDLVHDAGFKLGLSRLCCRPLSMLQCDMEIGYRATRHGLIYLFSIHPPACRALVGLPSIYDNDVERRASSSGGWWVVGSGFDVMPLFTLRRNWAYPYAVCMCPESGGMGPAPKLSRIVTRVLTGHTLSAMGD